ncbi:MAG: NAD-dependent epimerase/dehydratase family protein [Betaproteobacteria bacterium]|nr:NAD-dependent epimerase/dehydratase family protein [Betaproteobacteria bacterium]
MIGKFMHVLVTGANGFIGTHIVRSLLNGSMVFARVIAADRAPPIHTISDSRFDLRTGDIADADFVRSLFTDDIELVFHLAGLVSGAAEAYFDAGFATNLNGTRLVFEACRSLGTVPRI